MQDFIQGLVGVCVSALIIMCTLYLVIGICRGIYRLITGKGDIKWFGFIVLAVICFGCCSIMVTGAYAGYGDDVDVDIVSKVVSNRFTESAKKAVEKTDGMSEAEREYRLEWLLRELNTTLDESKYPMWERHKKAVDLEFQINTLRYRIAMLEILIENILAKDRINNLSGDELHEEFQKMLDSKEQKP